MEKKTMFGELDTFSDRAVFDSHRYGNLYFDGKDHGIEFFAFLHVDAYDYTVFKPNVKDEDRQAYLEGLLGKSIHLRDIGVTAADRIVLLSTCSADSTNGRDILVGRISDEVFDDIFADDAIEVDQIQNNQDGRVKEIFLLQMLLILILALRLIFQLASFYRERKEQNRTGG